MKTILGCILCALGGVGVGSFLVPLKFSRRWGWDNSWLLAAGIIFVVVPFWGLRMMVPSFAQIYVDTPTKDIVMVFIFGLIAGMGVYTWRYITTKLGIALTYALANSSGSIVGVLGPLLGAHSDRVAKLDGITLLFATAVLATAFIIAGKAGTARETELGLAVPRESRNSKKANVPFLATLVVLSAFAESMWLFSMEFQQSMKHIAMDRYHVPLHAWAFLNSFPYMVGVFVPTLIVTFVKMIKNGTLTDYWTGPGLLRPYLLAIAAGLIAGVGNNLLLPAGFAIIGPLGVPAAQALFAGMSTVASSISGICLGEWKGVSAVTLRKLYNAVFLILAAVTVVAVGNYLQQAVFEVGR